MNDRVLKSNQNRSPTTKQFPNSGTISKTRTTIQRFGRHLLILFLSAIVAASFATEQTEALHAQLPAGFVDELVAPLAGPTALAFTPDGRILIAQQTGQLRVIEDGILLSAPVLDLLDPNRDGSPADSLICNDTERGLLGVAVDPNFASNHYIYLYYTFDHANINDEGTCPRRGQNPENPHNTVGRFVLPANNQIDVATRTTLLTNIENMSGNHNAGDLHFGADGFLYISAGDGGIPPDLSPRIDSQLKTNLNGKILRIASDGSFPASNPYAADPTVRRCGDPAGMPAGSGPCGEIYGKGLRNPFRFAIKPGTNLLHINDVGQNQWEEIDLGSPGADYGWHVREGPCPYPPEGGSGCGVDTFTMPMYTYNHSSGCSSVTGAAFVPSGMWPASFDGSYLFADYVCAKIFKLAESAPYTTGEGGSYQFNYTSEELFTVPNNLAPVSMTFDPNQVTQSLYYAACPKDNNCSAGGQIRRIRYTGSANRAPTAHIAADPITGTAPLTVNFSGINSSDPDGDPLTYDWNFGDGTTSTNNTSATIQHVYSANGSYSASLLVHDDQGGVSDPVTLIIEVGNTPPVPKIISPTTALRFYVGQTITLVGSATDEEDGTLPANKLTWQVIQHHVDALNPGNTHTHPWVTLTSGNNIQFTTPDMEDSYAYDSYLELILKATDSFGASTTITQSLLPDTFELTFQSQPTGLVLKIGLLSTLAPRTITVWEKSKIVVEAVDPQDNSGATYRFQSWSDGGLKQHAFIASSANTTYQAVFVSATPPTQTATPTPSVTPTSSATPLPSATPQPSVTPSATTPGTTVTPSRTATPGVTTTSQPTPLTPTATVPANSTATATTEPTPTATGSIVATPTSTAIPTATITATITPTSAATSDPQLPPKHIYLPLINR